MTVDLFSLSTSSVFQKSQPDRIHIDSTGSMSSSFIFSDHLLEITFRLTAQYTYGPGELETDTPNTLNKFMRQSLWAHDAIPKRNANLYGVHNFVLAQYADGNAFGIFFMNSNAQEVVWTPLPSITYRTSGGIMDFFLLTGPKPADVIAQYYDLIGRPMLPPYWSLGFHLGRRGSNNLDNLKNVLRRNMEADIPIDGQWLDEDYMDNRKDWTVNTGKFNSLGTFIRDELQKKYGIKAIPVVGAPVIKDENLKYAPYKDGLSMDVFIKNSITKQPVIGDFGAGESVYPDFSHPNALAWWHKCGREFYRSIPFDGVWLNQNVPINVLPNYLKGCILGNSLDLYKYIPRVTGEYLFYQTLCPTAMHHSTTHYNRHNLYGYDQAEVTYQMLNRLEPNKRPFILSRSTFAGSGRFAAHSTGEISSSWESMRVSVSQVINFNIFAMPMVGADICGFQNDATEELCVRWSQLGAFYPFARNYNSMNARDQDPASWSSAARTAIRDALKMRYHLLPYIYSLFFKAHLHGTTVVRALAFEFPETSVTHRIAEQFMLGSCLLITPVLHEKRTSVRGYVPSGDWINLSTGERIQSSGNWMEFPAPLNVIPVFVRSGCVLPMQKTAQTTSWARRDGFDISVFLSVTDNGSDDRKLLATAEGELYWDNGEETGLRYLHVKFAVNNRMLTINPNRNNQNSLSEMNTNELKVNTIKIYGLTKQPLAVLLGSDRITFEFNLAKQMLLVQMPPTVNLGVRFQLKWAYN